MTSRLNLARVLNRRHSHYVYLSGDIEEVDKALKTHLEEEETTQRLLAIPGVVPVCSPRWGEGKNHASSRLQQDGFPASRARVGRRH